jgi:hypothetical protein
MKKQVICYGVCILLIVASVAMTLNQFYFVSESKGEPEYENPPAEIRPYIAEPYVGGYYYYNQTTPLIYGDATVIEAVELNHSDEIISTLFEYSPDGLTWVIIGVDDTETDNWWNISWNTSALLEGFYIIRATMTDNEQNFETDEKTVYFDPSPPFVEIFEPMSGAIISGITAFKAHRTDEDILYMELGYWNQISQVRRGGGPPAKFKQSGHGRLSARWFEGGCCYPVAAANALWRLAGKNPNLIKNTSDDLGHAREAENKTIGREKFKDDEIVSGGSLTDIGLALVLAWKFNTDSQGSTDSKDAKKGMEEFLKQRGLGCDNADGYEVTEAEKGSGNLWDTYTSQIYKGESIVVNYDPGTGGHSVTGTGYDKSTGNFTFIDSSNGWDQELNFAAANVSSLLIISPKNNTSVPDDCKDHCCIPYGRDYFGEYGYYCVEWDTTTVENGYYFVQCTFVDAAGNMGRDYIPVQVENVYPIPIT